MSNKKNHLQKEERFLIEKMLSTGKSINYIARLLERGVSTVSEEVSRYGGRSAYSSNYAHIQANKRQSSKKKDSNKVLSSKPIKNLVDKLLAQRYSPEDISKVLKSRSSRMYASPKSIRKYIGYSS